MTGRESGSNLGGPSRLRNLVRGELAFLGRVREQFARQGVLDTPFAAELLCLTALILGWTAILGSINVVLQIAVLGALIAIRPATLLHTLVRAWPLMIVPLVVCLSTLWSTAPSVSLRYGLQMLITALIALAVVGVLPSRGLLRSIFLSTLLICVVCIVDGRRGASAVGPVLIGILGSKNLMAVLAQLLLAAAVAVIADRGQPAVIRLLGLVGAPLAGYVLAKGESAGGLVTAVLGVALFIGLRLFGAVGPRWRGLAVFAAVMAMIPLSVGASALLDQAQQFSITVLHKDPGLTGRDYLWAHADRMIAERPWLGHGFRSAWLSGDADNIGLLRWAGIKDGKGFHFHDTYREWAVDFGLVGAALFCLLFAAAGIKAVVRGVIAPSAASAFFITMFLVVAIRAKVENVFLPFAPATVLLFMLAFWGWVGSREAQTAGAEAEAAPPLGYRPRPGPRFGRGRAQPGQAAPLARADRWGAR